MHSIFTSIILVFTLFILIVTSIVIIILIADELCGLDLGKLLGKRIQKTKLYNKLKSME